MLSMSTLTATDQALAIHGGPKAVTLDAQQIDALFHWPIVTKEDEDAVLAVLRAGSMSGTDITTKFEAEYAAWQGAKYGLASCNGTAALQQAMYGIGLGRGDELICPSLTYWASCLQAFSLGATVRFAEIDPVSLCIDPKDIERCITPRTRAIMVVHYCGHPADMDPIMAIARKHRIKVIEDVSHAHGALYKGRLVGSFGDVAAMSMMALKSFAIGEAGMLITSNEEIYQRAVAFGAYERIPALVTNPAIRAGVVTDGLGALPAGGIKGRLNQTCSAMGRVQLKHYPQRIAQIQAGINRFWDLLKGVPGLRPHRPQLPNTTMGGWYNPLGHYVPEELGGLPVAKFVEAVNAENGRSGRGVNFPLHRHVLFNTTDIYHDGKPTRIAFSESDVREAKGSLKISEALAERALGIPYFKHDRPEWIEQYANAFRKVALNAHKLK
jgi:dTDP-4-amino-4,6-dideoxygalactose transaminase